MTTAETTEANHIDVDRRRSGDSGFGDELTDVHTPTASDKENKSRKNLLINGVPAPKAATATGGLTGSPVKRPIDAMRAPVANPDNAQFQRNKPTSTSSSLLLIDLIHLSQTHKKLFDIIVVVLLKLLISELNDNKRNW